MIFGHIEQFVSDDLSPQEAAQLRCDPRPLAGVGPSTLLMRRTDSLRVGPFDESLSTGEFIEWHSRASDAGLRTITIEDVVCRRRLHRNNIGRSRNTSDADYVRMLKKVLDRRQSAAQ